MVTLNYARELHHLLKYFLGAMDDEIDDEMETLKGKKLAHKAVEDMFDSLELIEKKLDFIDSDKCE